MTTSSEHFKTDGGGTPTAAGRFVDVSAIKAMTLVPGLDFQPVLGESLLLNFASYEPNTEAPTHSHAEEQIVIVTEGEFEFSIDGEVRTMRPGDVAVIPPWVPHGARTLNTTCKEIDVFTPPRSTLVDYAVTQVEPSTVED